MYPPFMGWEGLAKAGVATDDAAAGSRKFYYSLLLIGHLRERVWPYYGKQKVSQFHALLRHHSLSAWSRSRRCSKEYAVPSSIRTSRPPLESMIMCVRSNGRHKPPSGIPQIDDCKES